MISVSSPLPCLTPGSEFIRCPAQVDEGVFVATAEACANVQITMRHPFRPEYAELRRRLSLQRRRQSTGDSVDDCASFGNWNVDFSPPGPVDMRATR